MRRPWKLGLAVALIFAFLYLPIGWLALASFNDSAQVSRITGFSTAGTPPWPKTTESSPPSA